MGRVFEKRKHKMFARYAKMAKAFTRIGKDIAMCVKVGGPDPDGNSRLRSIIQNAKAINMPKANIDAAIKRASSKDEKGYEEVIYEGKGPHGVCILIETATNNPTRTVANIRMHFSKGDGSLGKTGSLDFMFTRKGVFKIEAGNINVEELELELIDYGADEIVKEDNDIFIYTAFTDFGGMQKALEEKGINVVSSELTRIPTTYVEGLSEEQEKEVLKLIDMLEEDDDVQVVYSNMATSA
jgi:YebC/PmpR family DNA-binding regulatory protein